MSNEPASAERLIPLSLVKLTALMARTAGRQEVKVALIDGPVATSHPDLAGALIRDISQNTSGRCVTSDSFACMHGTFAAGILCARRDSPAPAICPGCTLLVRPIFAESRRGSGPVMPSAAPEVLAAAIAECVDAGAHVLNLSVALAHPSIRGERELEEALDHAARRGALVVAAAGNQGAIGSSAITRHPWVIPVIAYDHKGRPLGLSNLAGSVGRRGLGAPGDDVMSLTVSGSSLSSGGTSVAAPFVTGAIALLRSEFPRATANEVRQAVAQPHFRRTTVVPPLLDAWAAFEFLQQPRT